MDITNSERLHTKDNDPLQTEVPTSAYKIHPYLQVKIDHKANQTRAAKPTASSLLAIQVFDSSGRLWDCTVFSITFAAYSSEQKGYSTTYCLLGSLVEHSCNNPKFLAFGYLDEKPIDIGLMKFLRIDDSTEVPHLRYHSAVKPIALLSVSLDMYPFLRDRLIRLYDTMMLL
ncbi:hypothetical protein BHM03_00016057 [Ensete ventricosum]|nr:hypothetical protein BHM03_00016057 [Ensete ventricosum]